MLVAVLIVYVSITLICVFGHKLSYRGQLVAVGLGIVPSCVVGGYAEGGLDAAATIALLAVIGLGYFWFDPWAWGGGGGNGDGAWGGGDWGDGDWGGDGD